jgi:hypothetical protein
MPRSHLLWFLVALGIGVAVFLYTRQTWPAPNAKEPIFAALIGGYLGMRALQFVVVWYREGWKAVKIMKWWP